ncbi:hypothetical protein PR048_005633 [Dryococelus australis]|uniref:Uncharacterized protein n=1 Tax=Dryococelus australis TaxID=614101 RepID=A0ABQ9I8P8_9NEOP|nr:hypothetical protein PR048_005633 [Dryococelus australis]
MQSPDQTTGRTSNSGDGTTFRPQKSAEGRPFFLVAAKAGHIKRDCISRLKSNLGSKKQRNKLG